MTRRLLDLYCCAGGAAKGYYDAGFTEIVGVDIRPQKSYPYQFVQADALEYLARLIETGEIERYSLVHASPPCQINTAMESLAIARNGSYPEHPDLIPETRRLLQLSGKPYVIENVPGANLINPAVLCGTYFGLKVYRHRLFECNPWLMSPPHRAHKDKSPGAGNGKSPNGFTSVCGTGGVRGMNSREIVECWQNAMGIDWMNREELAQALPPAYTHYIGTQMLRLIG